MIRKSILFVVLALTCAAANAQTSEELKARASTELISFIDTVPAGQSFHQRMEEAIRYTEKYIADRMGADIFRNNYVFDDGFNDVFWIDVKGETYSSRSKNVRDDQVLDTEGFMRLIYHYNFSFRNKVSTSSGFSIHVQLAGNKSTVNVQGLVKLTAEKNFTNILTREQLLEKIRKARFKRDVRKYIKKNITVNNIVFDHQPIKQDIFVTLYYAISMKGIKQPAIYKFDPWTGELCCTIPTRFN